MCQSSVCARKASKRSIIIVVNILAFDLLPYDGNKGRRETSAPFPIATNLVVCNWLSSNDNTRKRKEKRNCITLLFHTFAHKHGRTCENALARPHRL